MAVRRGAIYNRHSRPRSRAGPIELVKHGLPLKRGGQPEEVANTILWLLSDEASYVTAGFIDVAGGR
jgi:NAD(P)-dependent dehydrogenase (short-subunit alcohol dehydrogenase family)